MAIPPVNNDDAQNRRYLAQVYKLFVQAGERGYQNVAMETLSMGMSGDFENAIPGGRYPRPHRHRHLRRTRLFKEINLSVNASHCQLPYQERLPRPGEVARKCRKGSGWRA